VKDEVPSSSVGMRAAQSNRHVERCRTDAGQRVRSGIRTGICLMLCMAFTAPVFATSCTFPKGYDRLSAIQKLQRRVRCTEQVGSVYLVFAFGKAGSLTSMAEECDDGTIVVSEHGGRPQFPSVLGPGRRP
jgi:hypothetical protein